ncbi:MAG TPA: helix-turn-helix transcriptional regulator [Streptosporangiaceae bacterium]|nr:helix-turn-helix transcriptional regulator [Streptosporangiaceae bacterium]
MSSDHQALPAARLRMQRYARLASAEVENRILPAAAMSTPVGRWTTERNRIADLTRREYQVFALLGKGLDNHEISMCLGVCERTVKLHVTSVLRKLGLASRLQAGLAAAEDELLAHFPKVQ